jgi:three-Cys-motif partner protein
MIEHRFGGDAWTEGKLDALENYLRAYRKIFDRNEKAQYFKTLYIDAFAGTGSRSEKKKEKPSYQLELDVFEGEMEPCMGDEYRRGSVRRVLDLDSKFDRYIFVDNNAEHVAELEALRDRDYPELKDRCRIWKADGCEVMRELCTHGHGIDWAKWRAVAFLDPYGMNVEWELLWRIAETKAIDLWFLWPLGMGVNRLLKRDGKPNKNFAAKLTRVFGVQDWENAFYHPQTTQDMFSEAPAAEVKDADWDMIGGFFLDRLRTIFAGVAPRTKVLYNSCGNPMYLLCFAAGNPKGAKTAIDIADYLMQA